MKNIKRRAVFPAAALLLAVLFLLTACGSGRDLGTAESTDVTSSVPENVTTTAEQTEQAQTTAPAPAEIETTEQAATSQEQPPSEDPQTVLERLRTQYPWTILSLRVNETRNGTLYVVELDISDPDAVTVKKELDGIPGDRVLVNWEDARAFSDWTPEGIRQSDLLYVFDYRLDELCGLTEFGDTEAARTPASPPDEHAVEEQIRLFLETNAAGLKLEDLTDEYVRENRPYDSVEAWKEALREEQRQVNRQAAWEEARQKLMSDCKFRKDPDKLAARAAEFAAVAKILAEQRGLSEKEYIRVLAGKDEEDYIGALYSRCEKEIHEVLLVRAVAAQAGLDVTEEEAEAYCAQNGPAYSERPETEKTRVRYLLLYDKVVEYITRDGG